MFIAHPSECPDCGSASILPVGYGFPGEELEQEAMRGEVVLGGCMPESPLWHCKNCLNRWPEDQLPSVTGTPSEADLRSIGKATGEYEAMGAVAAGPVSRDEPIVENYWQRPDGRKVFLLRFRWGKLRMEKRLHLVALGGPPVYDLTGGWPPQGVSHSEAVRLARVAAIRFERRPAV
jgi:hypothetical protein